MTNRQFRLTREDSGQPVVTATGEIDLANVDQFADVLTRAAADSDAITVDLYSVSYSDSAALRALFTVAATTKLTLITKAGGPVTTLLAISGLDRVADVETTD